MYATPPGMGGKEPTLPDTVSKPRCGGSTRISLGQRCTQRGGAGTIQATGTQNATQAHPSEGCPGPPIVTRTCQTHSSRVQGCRARTQPLRKARSCNRAGFEGPGWVPSAACTNWHSSPGRGASCPKSGDGPSGTADGRHEGRGVQVETP